MSRCLTVCIIAFTVGCQGQGGNPFMRTTVPPPATGAAAAPGGDYYGGNAATQPASVSLPGSAAPTGTMAPGPIAPGPVAPTPVVPPPEKRYTAPGGYNFPQGSVVPRKAVDPNPRDYRAGTAAIARAARPRASAMPQTDADQQMAVVQPTSETVPTNSQPAESQPEIVQTAAVAAAAPADENDSTEPAETTTVAKVDAVSLPQWQEESVTSDAPNSSTTRGGAKLRIVTPQADGAEVASNLPSNTSIAPEHSASAFTVAKPTETTLAVAPAVAAATPATIPTSDRPSPRRYFDRARPVSFAAPVDATKSSSATPSTSPEGSASYAHDGGYSWLRGKLEYSAAGRRWKLRYIPIDGQTDSYGGSVILSEAASLEGFRPGEFVTVHGTVGKDAAVSGSFSPRYNLERIERQGG
jgi:hypothetical protein